MVKSYANLSKDKDNRDAGRPSIYGTENNKPEGKAKKKTTSKMGGGYGAPTGKNIGG